MHRKSQFSKNYTQILVISIILYLYTLHDYNLPIHITKSQFSTICSLCAVCSIKITLEEKSNIVLSWPFVVLYDEWKIAVKVLQTPNKAIEVGVGVATVNRPSPFRYINYYIQNNTPSNGLA